MYANIYQYENIVPEMFDFESLLGTGSYSILIFRVLQDATHPVPENSWFLNNMQKTLFYFH